MEELFVYSLLCGVGYEKYDEYREVLDDKYLVIEGDGELAYCLDNETGEIVNWGLDNLEIYPEADDLESFILEQLEEGKENW